MTLASVLQELEALPPEAQSQVIDFIAFIKARYKKKQAKKREEKDDFGFGSIKVTKSISLDEMDKAIAQGACAQ